MYAFHFFFSLASPCCIVSAQLCEEWIPIEKKNSRKSTIRELGGERKGYTEWQQDFFVCFVLSYNLVCVLMLVLQCFSFYSTPHKLNRMQNFKSILYSSSNLLAFCQVDQRFPPPKTVNCLEQHVSSKE